MYVQRDSKSGEHEAIQIICFPTSKQKIRQIQDYRIEKMTGKFKHYYKTLRCLKGQ